MASVLCPRAVAFPAATRSTPRLRPASTAPAASFSTAARSLKPLLAHAAPPLRTSIVCRTPGTPARFVRAPATARHVSSAPAASPSPGSSPNPSAPPHEPLTWDRFFQLRRKRRYINLAASLVTSVAAVGVMGPVIAQQDIDSWGAQISGLDPMIVLGVTTFAVAAGGWLCGPSFGSAAFGVWAARRGWAKAIVEKEKNFYARIKTNRADPSASSPQNPIPDYYGEKIGSVKDYRRWLKDQRAFNRKKNKDLI